MEVFDGIFICTTNLMDKLDHASVRRFAFKIRFDAMTPDQRWNMFRQELIRLGGIANGLHQWEHKIRSLDHLTAGDFAVVVRQYELLETSVTPENIYQLLLKECEAKGGCKVREIGFRIKEPLHLKAA
jgi:SpoVK/Ycf46/Vps4 family AAA+-type ATPase